MVPVRTCEMVSLSRRQTPATSWISGAGVSGGSTAALRQRILPPLLRAALACSRRAGSWNKQNGLPGWTSLGHWLPFFVVAVHCGRASIRKAFAKEIAIRQNRLLSQLTPVRA